MSLRKIIFWLHLTAGCVAGLVILIMSVTGVLLAYEKQIIAWAERGYRVTPPADGARMPIETLLANVQRAMPGTNPASIIVRSEPGAPAAISFGRETTVLVNPYTGDVLGEGSKQVRAFMRVMIDWHRYLGMQGERRPIGKAITGACNLAFLFLVMSGFYLWFPRQWAASVVKSVTWFGRRLTGKARDWNWHNVIGFWSAVPLFFVVLTATFFNYSWANTALYRLTGSEPPATRPNPAPASVERRSRSEERPREMSFDGLNASWARAEKESADWKTITLRLSSSPSAPVTFIIDRGTGAQQPHKRVQLTLDRKTADVTNTETYQGYNTGRRVRLWIRWIHTGEAGGIIGQTIAMLASLGGAMLVWTGLSLAIRRFARRK
jgi:uncharacterized iron-regulated membrane protein